MRLFLEYDEKNTVDKITDENLETIYTFSKNELFNKSNKVIGKIKKSLFSNKKYKIIANNIEDKIVVVNTKPLKIHKLVNKEYTIENDITHTQIKICTKDRVKILEAKAGILSHTVRWEIDIPDTKEIDILILAFILVAKKLMH